MDGIEIYRSYLSKASLLLSEGHSMAYDYPLGMLSEQAEIVIERINGIIVLEAVVLQSAMSAIITNDNKPFEKLIEGLK